MKNYKIEKTKEADEELYILNPLALKSHQLNLFTTSQI